MRGCHRMGGRGAIHGTLEFFCVFVAENFFYFYWGRIKVQCGSLFAALVVRCTFYWRRKLGTPNKKVHFTHYEEYMVQFGCDITVYCRRRFGQKKMRKKCIAHTLKRTREKEAFFQCLFVLFFRHMYMILFKSSSSSIVLRFIFLDHYGSLEVHFS